MVTRHEAVAQAITTAVRGLVEGEGKPTVTRGALPERCPDEGLVNLVFEDPTEVGYQLGSLTREWSRVCSVGIVVQGNDDELRRGAFEAVLVAIGPLQGTSIGDLVDYIGVDAASDAEETPIEGDSPVQAGLVELTIFYTTSNNPLLEYSA